MTAQPQAQQDRLSRLRGFLDGAGDLEVVSHPKSSTRPEHFVRLLRLFGPPVALAAQLTTATAAATEPIKGPSMTKVAELPGKLQPAEPIRHLYDRYLNHGRSETRRELHVIEDSARPDDLPKAVVLKGVCRIEGIRLDYSKTDDLILKLTLTPGQRAHVLIHEDFHCRVMPAILKSIHRLESDIHNDFVRRFNESGADVMAILILARRDGIDVAKDTLSRLIEIRKLEAASDTADGYHDSRASLAHLNVILDHNPEMFASDAQAFATAIAIAVREAGKSFESTSLADARVAAGPDFEKEFSRLGDMIAQAANAYSTGRYGGDGAKVLVNAKASPALPRAGGKVVGATGLPLDSSALRREVVSAGAMIADGAKGRLSSGVYLSKSDSSSEAAVASVNGLTGSAKLTSTRVSDIYSQILNARITTDLLARDEHPDEPPTEHGSNDPALKTP